MPLTASVLPWRKAHDRGVYYSSAMHLVVSVMLWRNALDSLCNASAYLS